MIEDHSTRFSPSKLATYRECPQRYKFRYIDGLKRQGPSVEQLLGTCVHKAFEVLYEGLQAGRRLSQQQAAAIFEAQFNPSFSEVLAAPHCEAPVKEEWLAVGRSCVANYYRQYEPFDLDRTVAVEKRVGFPLDAAGKGYVLEGFIDRLSISNSDETLEIHDYKTAKSLPAQHYVDEDWQLALYEIAIRHLWPDTGAVRLKWHYVRHGKTLTSTRTPEQLSSLKAQAQELVARIKSDHAFSPVESALCGWCEYRSACPLFSHGLALERLPPALRSADEGRQAVDAFDELEQRKRALRADIRQIEERQADIERQLLDFACALGGGLGQQTLPTVSGSRSDALFSTRQTYKFPTKTSEPERFAEIEKELKKTALWSAVSHFDAHRLLEGLGSRDWPADWMKTAESALARFGHRVSETSLRLRRRDSDD